MSITEYLESSPFNELVRYSSGNNKDAVPYCGMLRKHPYDSEKCLMINDTETENPSIFEFRVSDIIGLDDLPLPVAENGSARKLVRLWVLRGAFAIRYEPFEVGCQGDRSIMAKHIREKIKKDTTTGTL